MRKLKLSGLLPLLIVLLVMLIVSCNNKKGSSKTETFNSERKVTPMYKIIGTLDSDGAVIKRFQDNVIRKFLFNKGFNSISSISIVYQDTIGYLQIIGKTNNNINQAIEIVLKVDKKTADIKLINPLFAGDLWAKSHTCTGQPCHSCDIDYGVWLEIIGCKPCKDSGGKCNHSVTSLFELEPEEFFDLF